MNSYQYDKPLLETYTVLAGVLTSAAVLRTIIGPAGMKGRVVNISSLVTTGVTAAASTVTVGPNGGSSVPTHTVPISSAGASLAIPRANLRSKTELVADTEVEIATGGEATAGAANLVVSIEWYN